MRPEQIVRSARDAGVILYLDGGKLAFKARAGQFTEPLRELVRAHRDELVTWLSAPHGQAAPIAALNQTQYPLSHMQRRLHFLSQLEGGGAQYNLRAALRLEGRLDLAALAGALDALVERHAILRTTFIEDAEGARQCVQPSLPVALERRDLSALPAQAQEQALQELMDEEARRDFDLARAGPLAARLLLLGPTSHAVLLTIHHLATDGTSMTILTREFMA
ncbi:condensation domain-containing protein, partial [Xanthomonas euroxanthea]|uniref:condensation domain-containing protein n=1 Tax=Xanthomonas euroxanthea TaxID=2259622 RepID=UPI0017CD5CDF